MITMLEKNYRKINVLVLKDLWYNAKPLKSHNFNVYNKKDNIHNA